MSRTPPYLAVCVAHSSGQPRWEHRISPYLPGVAVGCLLLSMIQSWAIACLIYATSELMAERVLPRDCSQNMHANVCHRPQCALLRSCWACAGLSPFSCQYWWPVAAKVVCWSGAVSSCLPAGPHAPTNYCCARLSLADVHGCHAPQQQADCWFPRPHHHHVGPAGEHLRTTGQLTASSG